MRAASALLLAAVALAAVAAAAQSPPCAAHAVRGDCTWTPAASVGATALTGVLAPRDVGGITVSTPPAVFAGPAADSTAAGKAGGLQMTNVILVGFDLPDPTAAGPETLLRPAGLLPAASAAGGGGPLVLRDVRILVSPEALRQHLLFFSPGDHNRSAAANTTFVYTDGASFLHVNSWFNQHTTWQSVGLLVAATLDEALATAVPPPPANSSAPSSQPSLNYVIAADAGTAVPQMLGRFAVATPAPLILYITSNVTLSKPPVPATGIDVMRSVAIVGLASERTSIDLVMQANQLIMAPGPRHQWGYVIFDSLILENLGQGDRRSAEIAKPLTVTYTLNFWSLYYDRNTLRNSNNNVTLVVHDKSDLDYMLYWLTVYRSNLPLHRKMGSFLRDSMGFTKWELTGKVEPQTLSGISLYTSCVHVDNNTYTSIPQVAKPLPLPPVDPVIEDALAKGAKSDPRDLPVVIAVSSTAGLQSALAAGPGQGTIGRDYVVILRNDMSLAPNASAGWPPPGGQPVPFPVQLLGEGAHVESDRVKVSLDFGFSRGILSIPPTASEGVLTIKRVSLVGLPQGPGAAEAATAAQDGGTPQAPELWTLLLWSIASATPEAVVLDNCEVALPPNEFEALRMQATKSRDFAIPLHANGAGGGRRLLRVSAREEGNYGAAERAAFITASGAEVVYGTAPRIQIASLSAGPVKGINITLTVDRRTGVPDAWPAQSRAPEVALSAANGPKRSRTGGRSGLPAWGVALVVVGAAAMAAAIAGAVAFALRRRRHAAWNADGKAVAQFDSSTGGGVFGGSSSANSGQKQQKQSTRNTTLLLSGGNLSDQGFPAIDVSGIQIATDRPLFPEPQLAVQSGSPNGTQAAAQVGPSGRPPTPSGGDSLVGDDAGSDRRQRVQAAITNMQQAILARRLDPAARARGASGSASGSQAAISSSPAPPTPQPGAEELSHNTSSGGTPNGSQADAAVPAAGGPEALQGGGSSVWGLAAYQVLPPGFEELLPAIDAAGAGGGSPPLGAALPSASTGEDGSAAFRGTGLAAPVSDGGNRGLARTSEVQLLDVMGRGSFSTVYKGIWMGRFVAVKVLPLQALASSESVAAAAGGGGLDPDPKSTAYERMAVMEAVISSTLSHPNIVQVYTYHITPVAPLLQRASAPCSGMTLFEGPAAGYELQLVMEFCEEGSLRDALDCGLLTDTPLPASDLEHAASDPDYAASDAVSDSDPAVRRPLTGLDYVLSLAHDVAVAMLHLHSEAMVHGDLKASNVLLARCSGAAAAVPATALSHEAAAYARHRFVAKVSDFGLSLHLGPEATHVSRTHAGTLSHMAPELMLEGRASRASDVYSYGILLWELLTGGRAFDGIPAPLLCIKVVQDHWRPSWPQGVCAPLRALAEACWSPTPGARPTFDAIVSYLEGLLQNPAALERDGSTAGGTRGA